MRFRRFVDELDQQDVHLRNRDLYSQGFTCFLRATTDESAFEWIKINLALEELDSQDPQIARFRRVVDYPQLSWQETPSTRFYQAITGYDADDPIQDHYFVVAYDRASRLVLIWYYNLI